MELALFSPEDTLCFRQMGAKLEPKLGEKSGEKTPQWASFLRAEMGPSWRDLFFIESIKLPHNLAPRA